MSEDKNRFPELVNPVLPKRGLVYQESNPQLVLCKPKLLPLKSMTLEKMERMQKEANEKAKEMQEEIEKEKQAGFTDTIGSEETADVLTLDDD